MANEPPRQDEAPAAADGSLTEPEAFEAAFRRYYAPLVRYAAGITQDAPAAADVVQDVFLKLWERRHRLEVEVSLQALLYTMVRHRALKVNRRRRFTALDVPVEVAAEAMPAPNPEGEATAEALRRRLHGWIQELPARRREAFVLSRYHGLSHREVAEIMGVSKRTVGTHILLALRELRERLDDLSTDTLST